METKKIFLGLDVGTNSCGWAVTDQDYNIIKRNGKSLHGIRLFEEASTAEERRLKRGSRRRNDRKKWRIDLLQDLFSQEIGRIDPLFFIRLNNSFFQLDDKQNGVGKYTIFNDKLFTDTEYYRKFPTIYHLRQFLKNTNEKPDIRLVYMACHHIIKYRGNFLMDGYELFSSGGDDNFFVETFTNVLNNLNEYIGENSFYDISINEKNIIELKELLENQYSGMKLFTELNNLWNKQSLKSNKIILKALSGLTINIKDLLDDEELKDSDIAKFSFSDENYEDNILPNLDSILGDVSQSIIELKKLFDWIVLKRLLGNSSDISSAMIKIYDKHKKDLKILKSIIRENLDKKTYNDMFKNPSIKDNYVNYVKTNLTNNSKNYVSGTNKEDFYKCLKKILGLIKNENNSKLDYIFEEIQSDNFLPKSRSRSNSIIPYQLHQNELNLILENASKYYSFLNDKSENNSVKEKIKLIHTFKIPYYVGPLNNYHANDEKSGFAWVERIEKGQVKPWDFERKIDANTSAEKFITRMTKKCTYLKGKDVLPKNSLLYSEFKVLNELNSLRVNGERLNSGIKEKILNSIFKVKKKITQKNIIDFLIIEGYVNDKSEVILSGIDGDFKNSLSSLIDFIKILGEVNYSNYQDIEKVIFYLTIFEDKNMAIRKIKEELNFSSEELVKIKRLNYQGWGNLSKEFLSETVSYVDENGVFHSIISVMREESKILQEVLYDNRYNFNQVLEKINSKDINNNSVDLEDFLNENYTSPAVKRSITQSVKIVNELKKITKTSFDKIFIEFTRNKTKSGRTKSRRNQIEYLYKQSKIDSKELSEFLEKLNYVSDQQLRSDRLFFYFLQLGRCAYSNQPIDLDNIFSNTYDIDHIIPQAIVKDDSLNNRVLVYGNINKEKTDTYPVSNSIQTKMLPIWKNWLDLKLISMDKFTRLTRKTYLTDDEIGNFINRQLVFTSQATKILADILIKTNPKSKIIYSKASNVSDFRHKFDILKSRDINDLHHAEDAYLNIVVGNVYNTKFGSDANLYLKNNIIDRKTINTKKLFDNNINGAWKSNGDTIKIVKKMINRNDNLFTKMQFNGKGALYDETIYPKGEGLYPIKESNNSPLNDTLKYGGLKSLKNAYFSIVKSKDKKGNDVYTLEAIPILFVNKLNDGVITLEEILKVYNGLVEPEVIVPKVLYNSLVELNDSTRVHLTGKSDNAILVQNATQIYADYNITKYFRAITKYKENKAIYNKDENNLEELILSVRDDEKDEIKLTKTDNLIIYDFILNNLSKSFFEDQTISSYVGKLTSARDNFMNLDVRKQAETLNSMVNLVRCNASKTDLSLIADKASVLGSNRLNKNITLKRIKVIDQSITGFFEKVRWSR